MHYLLRPHLISEQIINELFPTYMAKASYFSFTFQR